MMTANLDAKRRLVSRHAVTTTAAHRPPWLRPGCAPWLRPGSALWLWACVPTRPTRRRRPAARQVSEGQLAVLIDGDVHGIAASPITIPDAPAFGAMRGARQFAMRVRGRQVLMPLPCRC